MTTIAGQVLTPWQHHQHRWTATYEQRLFDRMAWAVEYVRQHAQQSNQVRDHFESLLALLRAAHARSALHPIALDLIEALHLLPARWGHWSEWEIELRFAAHLAEQLGQPDRQAVFLANLAHVLITLGQLDETITISTLAIDLARQQQSIEPWAVAGAALIAAYLSRGDTEQAQQVWATLDAERHSFVTASAAAQRIAQSQLGLRHIDFLNRSGQNETALEECGALIATLETLPAAPFDLLANIHSWCGVLFYHLGQYEAALTAVQRAQQLGRQAGDVAFVAGELANLGMIYMNLGDLDRAVAAFEQAVMELKHFKALGQYLNAVGTLGAVYLLRGELDQAFSCLTEQLALADGLHYVRETARALSNRGAVLMYQGRHAEGLCDIEACQTLLLAQGRRVVYIGSLVDLAYCCAQLGETTRAQRAAQDALHQADELGLLNLRLIALRCLAQIDPANHQHERLREALALARQLKRRLDEAGCLLSLAGATAVDTERTQLWNEGVSLLQQCGARAWLAGHSPDHPPFIAMTL